MSSPTTMAERQRVAEAAATLDATAIVVCGGAGVRFGRVGGKQLQDVAGLPMAAWSVMAAAAAPSVKRVVVVVRGEDEAVLAESLAGLPIVGDVTFAPSGSTRQLSVLSGLERVDPATPFVCIHDGARPLVRPVAFERTLEVLRADGALSGAVVGYPATDTLKEGDLGLAVHTPDRARFWCVQTPQTFRIEALAQAQAMAIREDWETTDDASLVERWGGLVRLVMGARDNIKVTFPEDLAMARAVLLDRIGHEGVLI